MGGVVGVLEGDHFGKELGVDVGKDVVSLGLWDRKAVGLKEGW